MRQQRRGIENMRQRTGLRRERQQVPHRELRLPPQRGLRREDAARAGD